MPSNPTPSSGGSGGSGPGEVDHPGGVGGEVGEVGEVGRPGGAGSPAGAAAAGTAGGGAAGADCPGGAAGAAADTHAAPTATDGQAATAAQHSAPVAHTTTPPGRDSASGASGVGAAGAAADTHATPAAGGGGAGAGGPAAGGGLGAGADVGLLSPVRAGTGVEAATGDLAVLRGLLDAEAGLTAALARAGVAPGGAAAVVASVAASHAIDIVALARRARDAGNPVVPLVRALTAAVEAVDPAAAEWVHRGATSQDIMDTALMLIASRALDLVLADLRRTCDALAVLADAHRGSVCAGRTLDQQAVPTTFGVKAAGWLMLCCSAYERAAAVRTSLPVQLGGAAGTLSALPGGLDTLSYYAAELRLAEPVVPWHTMRAPIADVSAALAFTATALGKIATDVVLLAQTEVGEVAEPAGPGRGGSSAMPHKRNPVLATLVRSAAAQVPAYAQVLLTSVVAEHERPSGAWHAEWQPLRESLRLVGGATATAAELVSGLEVFPDRMRTNLDLTGGAIMSERVASELGRRLGRASARALLTDASARASRDHRPLIDVLMAELESRGADVTRAELEGLFEPGTYVGVADEIVSRALAYHHRTFARSA